MRHFFILFFSIVSISISFSQNTSLSEVNSKEIAQKIWVDSVYNQFSFEEKVGQLFMVAAYSNKDEAHNKSIDKLVEEYKIGGLIFFQGGPVRQASLNFLMATGTFSANSKTSFPAKNASKSISPGFLKLLAPFIFNASVKN